MMALVCGMDDGARAKERDREMRELAFMEWNPARIRIDETLPDLAATSS
jgi:hypothetical protein